MIAKPQPSRFTVSDESESSAAELFNTTVLIEKKSKRVSFHNRVGVRECIHINNYTDEEMMDTWYTPKEANQMKMDTSLTIDLIRSCHVEANKHCSRGLEGKLNPNRRRRNKIQGWDAVMEEQSIQNSDGAIYSYDMSEKMIATAYISATRRAAIDAQKVGQQDYLEVVFCSTSRKATRNRNTTSRKSPFSRAFGKRRLST